MLLLLLACAPAPEAGPPEAAPTAAGVYVLSVSAEAWPLVAGVATPLTVAVTHGGAPVEGATLAIHPWMPDMGHGLDEDPIPAELEPGFYTAELLFPMSGDWELTYTVIAPPGEDSLTQTYAVE